jgi:hypothetical protein
VTYLRIERHKLFGPSLELELAHPHKVLINLGISAIDNMPICPSADNQSSPDACRGPDVLDTASGIVEARQMVAGADDKSTYRCLHLWI